MIFTNLNQIKTYRNGQISIFLISIIATLIIYAFISVNTGKIAIYQTRSANGADAGALAAAAVMATAFNYMADQNGNGPGENKKNAADLVGDQAPAAQ
jgi:hypothetical protein